MTEQVKKAAKSVCIYERHSSVGGTWGDVTVDSIRDLFNFSYTSRINHDRNETPITFGRARTNWSVGDLILFKSSVYVWLSNNPQPEQPEFEITTAYRQSGASHWSDLTKTEIEFEKPEQHCHSIVTLDNFICKIVGLDKFQIEERDRVYSPFYGYRFSYKTKTQDPSTSLECFRIVLEAEYIGTEQADGSIILP